MLLPYLEKAGFVKTPLSAADSALVDTLIPPVKERLKVLSDVVPLTAFIFDDKPVTDKSVYVAKGSDLDKTITALEKGSEILIAGLKEGREESAIEEDLVELSKELEIKINGVFQPIRVAITNSTVSLPLFDSIRLIGIDETESRLQRALNILKENN